MSTRSSTARIPGAFWVASIVTCVIALACFVSYRNRAFQERETAHAMAAARAIATGAERPGSLVAGGLVETRPGARYDFLPTALLDGRALGGTGALDHDKRIYDLTRSVLRSGEAVVVIEDDGARIAAAIPSERGVAVAITAPSADPESTPWWIFLGLLAIGAVLSAVAAGVGPVARSVGVVLAASGLAVPCYLWAGPWAAAAILLCAALAGVADRRGLVSRAGRELQRNRVAYGFFAPAALATLVLVAIPFAVGLVLGFYDHRQGQWSFVGLDNFVHILSGGGRPLSDPLNFWFTLAVTGFWTAANVVLHVTVGLALALVLQKHWLRGRGVYRMLFILPWAIPNYITALMWNGMFQSEYGAINGLLGALGLDQVSWFSSWATAFTANVCTNAWLGFPFMMVVALGALESIPRDLYEAADTDGATPWQRFVHVTLPHLRPAMVPAMVLGAIWTFNMFNVIYLVSDGQPGGSTDILVTEAYRWAFERGERYGLAAAYATVIFVLLASVTMIMTRRMRREAAP